jgi:hypothetical protein
MQMQKAGTMFPFPKKKSYKISLKRILGRLFLITYISSYRSLKNSILEYKKHLLQGLCSRQAFNNCDLKEIPLQNRKFT